MSDNRSRDEFLRDLARGLPYQEIVCRRLNADGIPCVTDLTLDKGKVADECDLDCCGYLIEVKSLAIAFSGPLDWPLDEAFIDTVSTWDRKVRPRLAIINISQATGATFVIPIASTRQHWYVSSKYDKARQMDDDFYAVSRAHLTTYANLVRYLRAALDLEVPVRSREVLEAEAKERRRALYVRERALLQNHRDGYIAPGRSKQQPYQPPPEYTALEREFSAEVPDEEWQTSPWRWHG